jgi:hypothetical protein
VSKSSKSSFFYESPRCDPAGNRIGLATVDGQLYCHLTHLCRGKTRDDIYKSILLYEPDFVQKPWPSISAPAKDLIRLLLRKVSVVAELDSRCSQLSSVGVLVCLYLAGCSQLSSVGVLVCLYLAGCSAVLSSVGVLVCLYLAGCSQLSSVGVLVCLYLAGCSQLSSVGVLVCLYLAGCSAVLSSVGVLVCLYLAGCSAVLWDAFTVCRDAAPLSHSLTATALPATEPGDSSGGGGGVAARVVARCSHGAAGHRAASQLAALLAENQARTVRA